MLKRILPVLTVFLTVLLDTAVLPVFYTGRFMLPLSLATVICFGIQFGRMYGLLCGLFAGLTLDITSGTLGMKLFPYMIIGYLIGFFLDQQPELNRSIEPRKRRQFLAVRAIWIAALLLVYEIVMSVYSYFYTAVFHWSYLSDLLIRVAVMTALCMLLFPVLHRLVFGKAYAGEGRHFKEVKHF